MREVTVHLEIIAESEEANLSMVLASKVVVLDVDSPPEQMEKTLVNKTREFLQAQLVEMGDS